MSLLLLAFAYLRLWRTSFWVLTKVRHKLRPHTRAKLRRRSNASLCSVRTVKLFQRQRSGLAMTLEQHGNTDGGLHVLADTALCRRSWRCTEFFPSVDTIRNYHFNVETEELSPIQFGITTSMSNRGITNPGIVNPSSIAASPMVNDTGACACSPTIGLGLSSCMKTNLVHNHRRVITGPCGLCPVAETQVQRCGRASDDADEHKGPHS